MTPRRKIILDALPGYALDLSHRLGIPVVSVRRILKQMHADGQVHICSWRCVSNGPLVMVFAAGAGEDAPNPAHLRAVTDETGNLLDLHDPERVFENHAARRAALQWADLAAAGVTIHPLQAALFASRKPVPEKDTA